MLVQGTFRRNGYKIGLRTLLLSLVVLLCGSCVKDDLPEVVERIHVGDTLPGLQLTLNDRTTVTNKDFTGQTVVLVFFSTTCTDCQKELPEVETFYESLTPEDNVRVIAVSRGENENVVAPFWQKMKLTLPYSAQPDRSVYELFANAIVPRIYIANPSGIVTATFSDTNMPSASMLSSLTTYRE